jgi:hypothetical protein
MSRKTNLVFSGVPEFLRWSFSRSADWLSKKSNEAALDTIREPDRSRVIAAHTGSRSAWCQGCFNRCGTRSSAIGSGCRQLSRCSLLVLCASSVVHFAERLPFRVDQFLRSRPLQLPANLALIRCPQITKEKFRRAVDVFIASDLVRHQQNALMEPQQPSRTGENRRRRQRRL